MKVPDGALVSPPDVLPQHVACPVVSIPQADVNPTLIEPTPAAAGATVSGEVAAVGAVEAGPAFNTVPAVAARMRASAPMTVAIARPNW
jgi:hypothetical protein